jgi:hypothetical protein
MEIPEGAITSFRGQYKFLSNFSFSPFNAPAFGYPKGRVFRWRTVEHYVQAAKSLDSTIEDIAMASTPRRAKALGRKVDTRPDWNMIKNQVMLIALRYKFYPSGLLEAKLLETGDAYLIEGNSWNDRYWGATIQENRAIGENHLGLLLMQVREELRV